MVWKYHLATSIADAGWGSFVRIRCYKEEETGDRDVFVWPHGTSKKCSECCETVVKALFDGVHEYKF